MLPAKRLNVRSKWRRSPKPTSPPMRVMLKGVLSTNNRLAFSIRTIAWKGLKLTPSVCLNRLGQVRPAQTRLLREQAQGDLFGIMERQIRQGLLQPRMIRPNARKLPVDQGLRQL